MKGLLCIPEMAVSTLRDVDPKTNTRRVISWPEVPARHDPDYDAHVIVDGWPWLHVVPGDGRNLEQKLKCPYGAPGDRLCLLTTWATNPTFNAARPKVIGDLYDLHRTIRDDLIFWHAGMGTPKPANAGKNRPGRFLPNTLRHLMPVFEIVSVRAERLQDITEADAYAEGISCDPETIRAANYQPVLEFQRLWNSINALRGYGWNINPWVWVITFKRVS